MSDFAPYSEKQKILTPAQWEELRFLDQDCPTAKAATQYIRAIVSRLLRIDKSGKIGINDFEFLVVDDQVPNASFISSYKTLNGKNIITISTTIAKLCKTEEQFAAVLAHELGHFTYDKFYGDNKNTIIQEAGADGRAIDILIAGGYNPEVYRDVCDNIDDMAQKAKNGKGTYIFDVHPIPEDRKRIVDTYLTYKHLEEGDFKVLAPTGQWSNFVKVITSNKDRYESYFSQLLQHKFPDGGSKPPIDQVFDLILSELRNGRLNNYQRMKDMLLYIQKYGSNGKRNIQSTQHFLEQLVDLYNQDSMIRTFLRSQQIVNLSEILKLNFRGDEPFTVFHPIDEDLAKIDEFMKTRDVARVKELAWDFHKNENRIFTIDGMKKVFGKPTGFKMPPRAMAKGHTMPTDWLMSEYQNMDQETRLVVHNMIKSIGFDCDYKWATDIEMTLDGVNRSGYEYMGKIVATNEKEIAAQKEILIRQKKYEQGHAAFEKFMYTMNTLYEFDKGKISATDVVNRLAQNADKMGKKNGFHINSVLYWLNKNQIKLIDYLHENKFLDFELQELNNSEAFAEIHIKPFIKMVKNVLQNISPRLAAQIQVDNPPKGKTWLDYLCYISLKYLDGGTRVKDRLINAVVHAARKIRMRDSDVSQWNVPFSHIIEHVSGIHTDRFHSMFVRFIHAAVDEGICSRQDVANILFLHISNRIGTSGKLDDFGENELINGLEKMEHSVADDLAFDSVEHYSVYANKDQWLSNTHALIFEAITYHEIEEKTDLHKLHSFLTAMGMVPETEQELINILSLPGPSIEDSNPVNLAYFVKEYVLYYYMRKKAPIKDLASVMRAVQLDGAVKFSDDFADEFADYIEKNNLMPTDFQGMYDLNAIMQKLNVFSKERSNHANLLNSLVEHISKMPDKSREEYSWNLLSGFYYTDDDDRHKFNRVSKDMGYPLLRNKLLEIYSDVVAKRLGHDDNSDEYFSRIQQLSAFLNQEHFDGEYLTTKRRGINKTIQGQLYRLISDKIQSQERVSKFLADDVNIAISDEDIQKKDLLGRGIQKLLEILGKNGEIAIYSINFLNQKFTAKSVSEFRQKCNKYIYIDEQRSLMKPSVLENFYNTFWSSDLKIRSVIMSTLLDSGFKTLDERIKYVCDMNFSKDSEYRADAEIICDCVIKSFEPYEQNLILAAVASADENKEEGKNASRSVGDGLRMFFEHMGPAWVKFGQLLSYVPDLPSEIRRDLGKLKDQADIPARWDVYTWLHEALPNDLYNRIERVEDIVGAGSFWMTAVVQFKNDNGEPEKKVIQLLRQNADARADVGFRTIEKAIGKLARKDPKKYKVLRDVARQAHKSAKYEVDSDIGNKQYEKAKQLYGNIHVSVEGTQYVPHVADWRYYGTGYKIMDYAQGATLSRVKVSDDERRKMALAYFTIELVNLFKGDVWDIDRHQGQQNFDVVSPKHVDINIYDTGAQLPKAPDNKNKVLLANIFFGLIQTFQSGKSIDAYLLQTIKRLDKLQNLNVDVSYVSNVQKGLLALSDILEYQKELKDADGNIIQQRKTLSEKDLRPAIMAVLQNPSVDKYISVVIKGRAVADKLVRLQINALKELARSPGLGVDNPVQISIMAADSSSKSQRMTKDASEKTEEDEEIMGISKRHIKLEKNKGSDLGMLFNGFEKNA